MYENDFLSVESGFLKFLSKTCWLFVRNFLILPEEIAGTEGLYAK